MEADPDGGPAPGMHPMVPRRYRVEHRVIEAADTVTLGVVAVDEPIDVPRPGQFAMLYAFGAGEVPISVSAVPDLEGVVHFTVRAVGPTTRSVVALEPGEQLGVRGPYGTAWGVEDLHDSDVVVVAGGLGLAPLRPAVRTLLARAPDTNLTVLIGARTPVDMVFAAELGEWRRRTGAHVAVTVDAAGPGWDGEVGLVTQLLAGATFDPTRTVALVCGPEVMMRFTARALLERGVDAERIRVSLERNMRCAIVRCGHCQLGPLFICADGPVLNWASVGPLLGVRNR